MLRLLCVFIQYPFNIIDASCYNRNEVDIVYHCADERPPPLTISDPNNGFVIIVNQAGDNILYQGKYESREVILDPNNNFTPHASIFKVSSEFTNSFEPLPTNCRLEIF